MAGFANIIKIATLFIEKSLKTQQESRELEIMEQNAIYICILGYSKIYLFTMKNADISRTQVVCT